MGWTGLGFLALGSLAQVGLLALGWFGYVHTVLPLFQTELLREQAAQLELDKQSAQKQLTAIAAEKDRLLAETVAVRASLDTEKATHSRLVAETSAARAREFDSREAAKAAQAAAKSAQAGLQVVETTLQERTVGLDKLSWVYFLSNVSFRYVFTAGRFPLSDRGRSEYGTGDFILEAAKAWPNAYKDLMAAIDSSVTAPDLHVPVAYADQLRSMLKARESDLECVVPDVRKMRDNFAGDLPGVATRAKAETNTYIAKLRADYEAKGQRVEITDEFRAATEKMYRMTNAIVLEGKYREELAKLAHECVDRGRKVLDEIMTAKVG